VTDALDNTMDPVIGVLTQALSDEQIEDPRFDGYSQYIMSTYVDYFEAQGLRVVPITMFESEEETRDKMARLNGVFMPGGGWVNPDYEVKAWFVMNEAKRLNDEGTFYPVWGTCQGFQYLLGWASDEGMDVIELKDSHEISLALNWNVADPAETKMFSDASPDMLAQFGSYPFAFQSHDHGIDPAKFSTDASLGAFFNPTSIQTDPNSGATFVATIEAYDYPFFGTQFHPEKNSEQWFEIDGLDHSWTAMQLNSYFAQKMARLAR